MWQHLYTGDVWKLMTHQLNPMVRMLFMELSMKSKSVCMCATILCVWLCVCVCYSVHCVCGNMHAFTKRTSSISIILRPQNIVLRCLT